jgi:phosphate transport system protein
MTEDVLYHARRHVVEAALSAHQTARDAILSAGETLIHGGDEAFHAVNRAERELDRLDREIDDAIADLISYTAPPETRELLACLKCMVDLERIGDLAQDFANRAKLVRFRLAIEDIQLLLKMCAAVEAMLGQSAPAFANQSVELAFDVIRADSQVDQLRNIIVMRHTEESKSAEVQESFHVVAMAQAMERAGDHAKNLAEEVCHLVNGHSVRHANGRRIQTELHQQPRLFEHASEQRPK